MKFDIDKLKYNEQGLIPAIVQEATSKEVLMMAWMNKEALQKTLATGETWFYSRSRQQLWHKGETSGHVQKVAALYYDCDADTLLILAEQTGGGACHQGYQSCFYRQVQQNGTVKVVAKQQFDPEQAYQPSTAKADIIDQLYQVVLSRQQERPEGSYTSYLFNEGIDKICKKIGEESAEVIIGAKNNNQAEVTYEAADLIYHLLVLLAEQGVTPQQIYTELATRRK